MRLETIPEVSEITWVCPGCPFTFDVDAVSDNVPEGMEFGLGLGVENGEIFKRFDATSDVPLQVIIIDDGVKLLANIPGTVTDTMKARQNLIWVLYEIRSAEPYPLLKGPIRLDGEDYFKGRAS